uniref:AlNc14C414G11476 protein n=1 Tax=Albugo laibachii Nc14 TaxID=890382 RepID=F0WZ70_9STRA|nr:AlNc14C414G11476 [Albugo laibachii Nc14]|eukprot:CCA26786.1 AlNc14C414G11476 [Albugo laibachii Nc14]
MANQSANLRLEGTQREFRVVRIAQPIRQTNGTFIHRIGANVYESLYSVPSNPSPADQAVVHQVAAHTLSGEDEEWSEIETGSIGARNDSKMEVGGNGPRPLIARTTKGEHIGGLSARKEACFVHVGDAACVETILNHEPLHRVEENAEIVFSARTPSSRDCLRLSISQLRVASYKAVASARCFDGS